MAGRDGSTADFRGVRGLAKIGRSLGASRLQIHNTFDLSYKGIPGIGNNQSLHTRYDTWRHISEAALFGPLGARPRWVPTQSPPLSRKDEYQDRHGEVGLGRQHDRNITQSLGLRGEVNALLSGESLLTAFVAARHETFAPDDLLRPESRLLHSRRRALAVGTEVEVGLGPRLTLNAGTQAEGLDDRFFDRKYFAPSAVLPSRDNGEILWGYRMGAALDLGAGLALKAHNGRYQRAPNFFELFGDRGAVIGNTNLVSEEGRNWDLGLVFRGPRRWSGSGAGRGRVLSQSRRRPHSLYAKFTAGVAAPQYGSGLAAPAWRRGSKCGCCQGWRSVAITRTKRAENRTPFSFERGNDLPNAPRHRLNASALSRLGSR